MSDCSSDGFSIFDFSAFTEDDFTRLDAIQNNASSPRTLQEEDSFQIDTSAVLNLESLTEEDFAKLDSMIAQRDPIIAIELEEPPLEKEKEEATSPIQQFRNNGILSVSDLVSPFW
jgi:exonuclease V